MDPNSLKNLPYGFRGAAAAYWAAIEGMPRKESEPRIVLDEYETGLEDLAKQERYAATKTYNEYDRIWDAIQQWSRRRNAEDREARRNPYSSPNADPQPKQVEKAKEPEPSGVRIGTRAARRLVD